MASKKHLRKITVLATILLILGVLLYLQNLQKVRERQRRINRGENSRSLPSGENSRSNMLNHIPDWDPDAVSAIVISRQSFKEGGEDSRLELSRSSGEWQLSFPKGIPLRDGAMETLVRSAFGLPGKELPGSFDLSRQTLQERYGFNRSELNIDYFGRGEEGLLARVLIGARIPGVGGYYATVVPGVGVAPKEGTAGRILFRLPQDPVDRLATDANGLREQQLPQVILLSNRQEYLNVLELRNRSNTLRIEYKDEDMAKRYDKLNELQSFVMTRPYSAAQGVDQYRLEQLLKSMPNPIKIIDYVEDQPADLAYYGLDKARRQEIYAEDNKGNTVALWLGREAQADRVYAMQVNYESVFTVSKEVLAVLNFEPFQIVDKFVLLVNIDKVERVSLRQSSGVNYNLEIQHSIPTGAQAKTQAEGVDNREIISSKLTGTRAGEERSLDENGTKDLYQDFLSILLAGEVSDSFFPVDKAEVSMIYSFRDGQQRRADFYNYSAKDYYVVSINGGKAIFVTEKRQLKQLLESFSRVLQTGWSDIVR
ncbi:DUF4340 domain-containing protein [Candidatus Haliotispira prima]|uniref:DUF4340 domain-containing protein n=1 Tax=Candidatus Haliotispira prima TaxID=3034016 RepID=A0ABY8MFU0_9SPIO|nr:DUF4340 domain-containing protein [Candidatus Haliotispira prima]